MMAVMVIAEMVLMVTVSTVLIVMVVMAECNGSGNGFKTEMSYSSMVAIKRVNGRNFKSYYNCMYGYGRQGNSMVVTKRF